jgi:hypothetical protein
MQSAAVKYNGLIQSLHTVVEIIFVFGLLVLQETSSSHQPYPDVNAGTSCFLFVLADLYMACAVQFGTINFLLDASCPYTFFMGRNFDCQTV